MRLRSIALFVLALVLFGLLAAGLTACFSLGSGAGSAASEGLRPAAGLGPVSQQDVLRPGSGVGQLFTIFSWLIWICVVGGVLSFLASIAFPLVPGKVSIAAVLTGTSLALAKDFIAEHLWSLKLGIGVASLVFAWPHLVAAYRWNRNRLNPALGVAAKERVAARRSRGLRSGGALRPLPLPGKVQ